MSIAQSNVLYRFLNSSGTLLYVGITMNPPQRFKAHQSGKDWWSEVSDIKIETFDTRELLAQAEKETIVKEKPLYNFIYNGKSLKRSNDSTGLGDQSCCYEHPQTCPTCQSCGAGHREWAFKPNQSLVGKWFHTTTTCVCGGRRPVWQGQVVSSPSTDVLLLELYEWLMGEPSGQELIALDDFMSRQPLLYDSDKDMRFSTKYGALRHQWGSQCESQTDEKDC